VPERSLRRAWRFGTGGGALRRTQVARAPLGAERQFLTMASRRPRARRATARAPVGERAVERLRRICMGLPEAEERLSHGEPTWFAGGGKVFAMLDDHHHGASHLSVHLPLPFGAQEALVSADPERYFRPPYVGGRGWVGVVLDGRPDWRQVEELVLEAFRHVASGSLVARLAVPPR